MFSIIRVAFFYSKRASYTEKATAQVICILKERKEVFVSFEHKGVSYGCRNLLISEKLALSSKDFFFSTLIEDPEEIEVFFSKGEPESAVIVNPNAQVPYKHIFKVMLYLAAIGLLFWWTFG